jgi:ATP-binding cassette subfamily B protein/subfamily B ATP-binding cassette protein MsbA
MPREPFTSSRRYADYLRRRRAAIREGNHQELESEHRKPRRTRSALTLFRAFLDQLRGQRLTLIAALTTLTFATVIGLAMPASTKIALDYILTDNPGPSGIPESLGLPRDHMTLLWILSAAMLGVTILNVTLGMWGRWQTTRLTQRLRAGLRRRAFEQGVRLPLHRVYELRSGGAASIMREDAGGTADLLFSMVYNPWRAIIQLIGTLIILAAVDWLLLLGAIALLPILWLTHRTWIARLRPVYRDIRRTRTGIDSHATESFGGMRVVRGFNRQQGEAARFTRDNHFMARQEILAWWWSRGIEIAWMLMIPVASAAVLLYGGWRVVQGSLTIGDVMMFSAYLLMLLGPLEALASSATAVQNNLAGFDRVLDLLAEKREFADSEPKHALSRATARGEFDIENLTFTYPRRKEPALVDVSLHVEAGETIALVGPSGAGKTTLCNLIARFFDPSEGRILFDAVDLKDIDVNSYRSLLGIVEQDVFLFDGTVAENIAYARRDASMEDIRAAARAANADEFIESFDDGYDTRIGERGVRLSGGQKQRIAVARAILADPIVLILDEATSNLDSESELLIQRSLRELMRNRTSFVIAHRLSTIRHADRIVVIEDGRVTEYGTHEDLVTTGGKYADLLRLQLEGAGAPKPESVT